MQDILEGLNQRQREAVQATEGRIRVVAGAGSGKTKALTCRYAYLVNELGIDPANILCLTFTNKAAQEMRQRIGQMVHSGDYNDYVCTIHGFCVKFLRKEIFRLGYPKSFTILDEEDTKVMAKQVMEELGLNRTVETVRQFLDGAAARKVQEFLQQPNYIDRYLVQGNITTSGDPDLSNAEVDLDDPFVRFLKLQQKTMALDFQDLIFFTIHIMKRFPAAVEAWQREMQYVMLDEAQDCNKSDWTIVETLAAMHGNLFIVGDPDQAIYEWRGARPKMFIEFQSRQDIVLDQNYRSTTSILDVANSIISRNRNRLKKDLYSFKAGGAQVTHFHGRSDKEEAQWIARQIKMKLDSGQAVANDFAILYRASYLSRSVEQELMNSGIDYVIWGGVRFFDRAEIKDALSYLRLIDAGDDLSFLRVCNTPSRKIGKVFLQKLKEVAKADDTTMYEALKRHISQRTFYKESVVDFIALIEECRQYVEETMLTRGIARDHVISDVLDLVLEKSGYKQMIREDDDTDRLDNLEELLQSVKVYEETNREEELTITGYLQDIALYTNADYRKDAAKVRLMTIHQAKGLEFPFVFVIGLSEGIFPSMKTIRERKGDGEEEERRLMYVAITRAEKGLYLTESEGFNAAARLSKYPSRFLKEIRRNLFVTEGDMDDKLWNESSAMIRYLGLDYSNADVSDDAASLHSASTGADASVAGHYPVGSKVRHKVFGEGKVRSYKEEADSYEVEFLNGDVRTIRSAFIQPLA